MNPAPQRSIADMLADVDLMNEVLGAAMREAVLSHARAGHPVATSRNGQVIWVPPEEILARFANGRNGTRETPRPDDETSPAVRASE